MIVLVFQVLTRHLKRALTKKRPQLPLDRVILHQDNAPCHKARTTLIEIDFLGFNLLEHPPYSPDLAPCDFRLFPEMKAKLRGIHFNTVEELQTAAKGIVKSFDTEWYKQTFDKWVARHEKCVRVAGDYVEK